LESSHNQWVDSHEQHVKVQKADNSKWDNDWDTINKQREEIEHIKERKRLAKLAKEAGEEFVDEEVQEKLEKSHNQWVDTHAKQAKVIKADNSKWDNDWDKINKQREEIQHIKEKQRLAKLAKEAGEEFVDEEAQEKLEKSHNQWVDTHEKKVKVRKADNSKWDNDWSKIEKQRAEIKAIKEKQRLAKLEAEANGGVSTPVKDKDKIEKSHNKWKDSHAKKAKVIKADNSKWDNDWDKIEKQRAEIKAIKERKRQEKLEKENELKKRNSMKTTSKYANKSHEKKPKKIAAKERVGTDWDKIEKQRAEIKRIKEKRRLEKEMGSPVKKKGTKTFGNPHEQ